jgi:putative FmdB family regulatory protein
MPTYEFRCIKCRKVVEIQRSIKDESPGPLCMEPGCDGQQQTEQLISKGAFSLKGVGWAFDGYSKTGLGDD